MLKLYDSSNIDQYVWPSTEAGQKGYRYLYPLIKEGVQSYVANVETKLYLLVLNDRFLPLSVNDQEYMNSYIASNYYGAHLLDEHLLKKKNPLRRPLVGGVKWLFETLEVNRCVIVNNWMITNALYPPLSAQELRSMLEFLKEAFPDHLLLMRHINHFSKEELISGIQREKIPIMKTRGILFYDGKKRHELSEKAQSHHKKDKKLLQKLGYTLTREVEKEEIPHLLSLYEKVYIEKHTAFSPRYTERFLEHILDQKILHFMGLKKEGKIEGIVGFYTDGKELIAPFFGYDTSLSYAKELYRLLTTLILEEAERLELVLNDSSGGEKTKRYRGLKPSVEYTVIFKRHLPWKKRLFWGLVTAVYNGVVFPLWIDPAKKR